MNVLHIDEQRGWRGGEQQASYLIRGLIRRGHPVVVAGRPDSPFLQSDHGVVPGRHSRESGNPVPMQGSLVRVAAPFLSEFDLWTAWRLSRVVTRYQIDILHAHTSHAHTMACLARRLAGRGKVVVSRRVDFAPRNDAFNRWKYAWPDRIVAISHFIAQVLRQFGVPESKLAVVRSATDLTRFDVPPLPRSSLGIPEGVPLLGNVAALVGHKDHATLIDAMPLVLRELPALHLVIAGEGALRTKIEAHIARLGLTRSIHTLGFHSEIPRLLRALDAFVLSSSTEGLGTSILDAMACGLPVAATAAGGIPEMVVHEQTGLLSPVRQPEALAANIVRLFREPGLARTLSQNGVAFVREHFAVDQMVEGNIRVYESLLR